LQHWFDSLFFWKNFRSALKTHLKVSGNKSVHSLQPSVLLVFLLVSGEQTFRADFAVIEQEN